MDHPPIIRSTRKTLGLHLTTNGIEVRAPQRMPLGRIRTLITKHKSWIAQKNLEHAQAKAYFPTLTYTDGEVLPLLDTHLTLKIKTEKKRTIFIQDTQFIISHPNPSPKILHNMLKKWLITHSQWVFEQRVNHYIHQIKKPYKNITTKTMKSRWGSCSRSGELTFNWALMFAPLWVLDYVVIHELCHLIHMHHKPSFWELVEAHYPQQAAAKKWLKHYGLALILDAPQ